MVQTRPEDIEFEGAQTFGKVRPTTYQKRPTTYQKRPTTYQKRPATYQKRPANMLEFEGAQIFGKVWGKKNVLQLHM